MFHVCGPLSPDKVCRDYGCSRIHVNTPWAHIWFPYWPTGWWPNETFKDWTPVDLV